jgi:hypothetical protein
MTTIDTDLADLVPDLDAQLDKLGTIDGARITSADMVDIERVLTDDPARPFDFADLAAALEQSTTGGRMQIIAALLWVYHRKVDPTFTYQNALDLEPAVLSAALTRITQAGAITPQ